MPQIEMDINIFEQVPVHIRALCGNGAKQLTYNRPFESVSGSCYFIPDVVNLSSEYEGFNASLMDMKTGGYRFQNRERTTCNGTGKSTNLHLDLENHLSLVDIFPKNLTKAISKNTVKASYQSTSDTLQDEIASAQNSSHYSEQDRGESDTFLSLMDGKEKFSYDQKKKKGGYQQGRSGCERGWYYFRLLVILPLFLPAEGGTSQCVDGQVQINKSALLMFPFDSSIIFNQKETIAHVDHCPFNTTICDPVIQLKFEGNSILLTLNRSGYQLVNSTAGRIFVLIPSARPEHAGRYRFTIFGEPSFTPCSLTIIDSLTQNWTDKSSVQTWAINTIIFAPRDVSEIKSTADIAQSTADIPQSTADIAQNYNHIVPIVLGAAVFMMTLIFIAVYFFYPKKFDRFCKATASTSEKCSKEEAQHLQASNGHIA